MDFIEDVQEKGEESIQKAKAACCCSCLGFILFPLSLILLGWNEKRFVCTQQAYGAAQKEAVTETCTAPASHTDTLVFVGGCALGNPETFSPAASYGMGGMVTDGRNIPYYTGYLSKMTAEMYQCVESSTTVKNKDGSKSTEYNYKMEWSASYKGLLNSPGDPAEKQAVCGSGVNPNPPPPLTADMGNAVDDHYKTASDATLGNYTLDEELIQMLPLDMDVSMKPFEPYFNATANNPAPNQLVPSIFAVMQANPNILTTCPQGPEIGCIRLHFKTTSATIASALGEVQTQKITNWYSEKTWLCSREPVMNLMEGVQTLQQMMDMLNDQNYAALVALRIGFWLLCCLSVYMTLYPLFAFFDILSDYIECIPCVGDFIAGMVDTVVGCALCCFAFAFGTSVSLLDISIAWLFVRPMVGVPLFLASLAIMGGIIYWRSTLPSKSREMRNLAGEDSFSFSD